MWFIFLPTMTALEGCDATELSCDFSLRHRSAVERTNLNPVPPQERIVLEPK